MYIRGFERSDATPSRTAALVRSSPSRTEDGETSRLGAGPLHAREGNAPPTDHHPVAVANGRRHGCNPPPPMGRTTDILTSRRTVALLGLGFLSGLPAAALDKPLVAWMAGRGATAADVGTLAAWAAVPATFKFAWAPALDRFAPTVSGLGRRRAWLAVTQAGLAVGLVAVAVVGASATIAALIAVAVAVAVLSASQDVVGDAYRTDVLPPAERGIGTAAWVAGWRVAAIALGGGMLLAVGRGWATWPAAYGAAAVVMAVGVGVTVRSPEPAAVAPPTTLRRAVVDPLREFLGRPRAWAVLPFVVLFKLPEALVARQPTKFLTDLGVGLATIGGVQQGLGVAAAVAGTVAGGVAVARAGLRPSLAAAGVLGAASNLGFYAVARAGPVPAVYVSAIVGESFCAGLVTAAFVAFLMAQCDRRYSAFQYALLSGLMRLGDVFTARPAGRFADRHGWAAFFLLSVAAAVPGLALLPWVPVMSDRDATP